MIPSASKSGMKKIEKQQKKSICILRKENQSLLTKSNLFKIDKYVVWWPQAEDMK